MCPIGEYLPDPTEKIRSAKELPPPEIVQKRESRKSLGCPKCGRKCPRHQNKSRDFHDIGNPDTRRPRDVHLVFSQHYCAQCDIYFYPDLSSLVPPYSQYSLRVVDLAVHLVVEDGLPYGEASWNLWRDHRVWVPRGTVQNWVEASGKKGSDYVNGPYLDDVLREFSGYIAIDEVYDGPFCILVVVDNKKFHRLLVEVLDHSPDHSDIHRFLTRFREILIQRNLVVKGITTDGSPLYPEPLAVHFPGVPHQLCEFHVIKEINLAVLRALAQVRREIKKSIPKVKRGKAVGKREIKARRQKARLEKKITDLFENRYLLVQRTLSPQERKCLNRITRGYPVLQRFREIIDGVYSLFDRRCKLETGIKKLEALRARVLRFQDVYTTLKKILSPNLEKALTFLDEKLLPSTSNGVERENRRFRKMQKSVYRVRTHQGITQRIALDMIRGVRFRRRPRIIGFLQEFRNG